MICPDDISGPLQAGGEKAAGSATQQDAESGLIIPTIGFYANDSGNDAGNEISPTLRSMELGGQNCPAVAFKPSYFTRGKDGAPSEIAPPLSADADKGDQDTVIAFDTTQITSAANYSRPQPGDPCHPLAKTAHAPAIAFSAKDHGMDATEDLAPTLRSMGHDASHANGGGQLAVAMPLRAGRQYSDMGDGQANIVPVAFQESQTGCREYGSAGTLRSNGPGHDPVGTRIREGMAVRRLTPLECERLQGFPDGYTAVEHNRKPAADGPRYKALGNSMAVPVLAWIGRRICEISPKS